MENTGTGRVVVEVWLNDYVVVPLFLNETRELARRFNLDHPGYEVRVVGKDSQQLPEELVHAAREGTPPAIAQQFYTSTQTARDLLNKDGGPLFTSVGRAINGRREILGVPVLLDDILPAARDYYTDGDELRAMPPLTSTTLLYANTTLLDAAGVDALPRTWAEVDAACRAVARLPGGPAHAITWPNHGWLFQQAVAYQGGLLADHDNGRAGRAESIDLASEAMLSFVEWWQRLHAEGHFFYPGTQAAGETTYAAWQANFTAFAEQRVAFVCSTSVEADRMIQAGLDGGFAVRAGRLPFNGDVPFAGNVIGGDSLWLVDGLDQDTQNGALAFLQYMINPRNAAGRHKTSGFVALTRASVDLLTTEGWFEENPHHRVALDQLDAGDRSPAARGALLGDFAGLQAVMTRSMHDVLLSGADPKQRFTEATAEAQKLLDEYNNHCVGDGTRRRSPHRLSVG